MKTLTVMALLCLSTIFAYSQTNPMFKTEQEVRRLMDENRGQYDGSDYSSIGERCIKYSFAMSNPEKYLDAVFFINDKGICDGAKYYYPHSSEIKNIVSAVSAISDYKKVEDSFAWVNSSYHFSIEIVRPETGDGFFFQYNHLKQ